MEKTKPPLSHYLSWTNAGYYVIDVKLGTSVSFSRTQMKSSETNTSNTEENSSAYIIRGIEASDARSFIHLQEEIFQETDFMYNVQNELDLTVQQLRKNLTYWKQLKTVQYYFVYSTGFLQVMQLFMDINNRKLDMLPLFV